MQAAAVSISIFISGIRPMRRILRMQSGFVYSLALLGMMFSSQALAADAIGLTAYARGAVSAQFSGGEVRLLGRGADVFNKDVVTTGQGSYAIIKLNDKSQISIRPDSVISMVDYSEEPEQESTTMRLFKGGLRTITGYIADRNPEGVKIETRAGTIGLKNGKMDARLCEAGECKRKTGTIVAQRSSISKVGGRVAYRKGELNATDKQGKVRDLPQRSQVVGGDTIATGTQSYAVLAFIDGTRATMKAETQFFIEDYNYDKGNPANSRATLNLVKGGLRTLTGSIGDDNPAAFKVKTAAATIGIRGTGFDLLWLGPCVGAATNCGLIAFVWEGSITADNNAGSFEIGLNRAARIRNQNSPPEFITTPPVFTEPRPDEEDIDMDDLFGEESEQAAGGGGPGQSGGPSPGGAGEEAETAVPPGLYVSCYDSACTLTKDDKVLNLTAGEMGVVSFDDGQLTQFETVDPLLANDTYFSLVEEGRLEETTLYELIDNNVTAQNAFECYVVGQ